MALIDCLEGIVTPHQCENVQCAEVIVMQHLMF